MSEPRFAALAEAIEEELGHLEQLMTDAAELRPRLVSAPGSLDRRAAGSILHDLYNGAERVFERIARTLDGGVPSGTDWHVALLRQMTYDIAGVRPAVISEDLADALDEYLRFRHVFRNVYGRRLRWERMSALIDRLEETHDALAAQLRAFTAWLRQLAQQT